MHLQAIYMYIAGGVLLLGAVALVLVLSGVFQASSSNAIAGNSALPSPYSSVANSSPPTYSASPMPTPTLTPSPSPTPEPIDLDVLISEFFEVKADKYYNEIGYSSSTYDYTDKESYMLAQLIYLEARGESYKGKLAVANVVMNRVLSRGYPGSTIEEVITAPGQFCYNYNVKPNSSCKRAARDVLAFEKWVIPQNIYYFRVSTTVFDWGNFKYALTIGNHAFYEYNYYGRYRGDAIPPQLYQRTFQWPEFGCKPGARVYKLQKILRALSYDVKADGYFGKSSKEAIKDFQKKNGLRADGIAGPDTLKALINKYGVDKFVKNFKS